MRAPSRTQVLFVEAGTHTMRPALYDDDLVKVDASGGSAAGADQFLTTAGLSDSPQGSRYDRSRGPGDRCGARSGAAIVRRLRADGVKVAAADLAGPELTAFVAELSDDGVLAVPLDVTSEPQWAAGVTAVLDTFGALTALVNNAGVLHRAPLAEETAAGFEKLWRVNTLGPFLGIQACLPALREAEGASIVNTCSTGALRPFPNHVAYGSSKWALRGSPRSRPQNWRPPVSG